MNFVLVPISIFGFVSGVVWRSYFNLGISFVVFVFLISVFIYLLSLLGHKSKVFLCASIFSLSVSLGMARVDLSDKLNGTDIKLNIEFTEKVILEGVVRDEPDESEDLVRAKISVEKLSYLSSGQSLAKFPRNVMVIGRRYPKLNYGDKVTVIGKIQPTKSGTDAKSVAYYHSLEKDGIYFQTFYPNVSVVGFGGSQVVKKLFDFKNSFTYNLKSSLSEPHASLMAGLVVGDKNSLGQDLSLQFRRVGLSHVVVLSGYNLSIVADSIIKTFSFLSLKLSVGLGSIGIILFTLMTGASASAVRASIMVLVVLLAKITGKVYYATSALVLAGFLMILHNPKTLVFDLSFQLSFLSTLGLIFISPIVEDYIKSWPSRFGIKETFVATVSAQLSVLPLILYKLGNFSLVSLPSNLLVLFVIPLTMFVGFVTGVVGFLSLFLAKPFAFVSYWLLEYQLGVVSFLGSLPMAAIDSINFPWWLAILSYSLICLFIYRYQIK